MAHARQRSESVNHRAQLANAYQELGKELSSEKLRVVGNYTLGRVIGEGTYGKVRLGTHRITSIRVAIKQIPKALSAQLTREIHHHRTLHHPHIAQLYEVIATESSIWLVTELCTGGELFDYLVEKGRLAEREARAVFGQLCVAVAYCHGKGVVHRDLKLENVLLDERCQVKLGDFGFTREFEQGRLLETFCGTTGYASPEMLLGEKYSGEEVDIWSLGVILYSLLCGGLPFDDDDEDVMRAKVIRGVYAEPDWLSTDARDLISKILQRQPEKRLPIRKILEHPWFTKPLDPSPPQLAHVPPRTASLPQHSQVEPLPPTIPSPSQNSDATSSISEKSYHSAPTTEFESEPTTPEVTDGGGDEDGVMPDSPSTAVRPGNITALHRTGSQATIKTFSPALDQTPRASVTQSRRQGLEGSTPCEPVLEEEPVPTADTAPIPTPAFASRTPIRTKRRSVSSAFSLPSSPTTPLPGALPLPSFLSLLDYPHPVVFTAPLERALLNSLSEMGFDTGQMVHSVLTDACDPSGAVWWMLRRKAEKREEERREEEGSGTLLLPEGKNSTGEAEAPATSTESTERAPREEAREMVVPGLVERPASPSRAASQTVSNSSNKPFPLHVRPSLELLSTSVSAPELFFSPATPVTPQARGTQPQSPPISPSAILETPSRGKRVEAGKGRAGSISMLQRASTVLGAAGLGRKKSGEVLKEDQERDAKTSGETDKEKAARSSDDTKSSQNSRSPAATLVPPELRRGGSEFPWIFPPRGTPDLQQSPSPSATASPSGDTLSPLRNEDGNARRGGFMSTIRTWWQENPRKRKPTQSTTGYAHMGPSSRIPAKRKPGIQAGKAPAGTTPRRPAPVSRRSSSVNSRRSSIVSVSGRKEFTGSLTVDQLQAITRQRSDPSRRSFTPTSERGEFLNSRPASVRSSSYHGHNTPRIKRPAHGRQSSNGSGGSASRQRAAPSPLEQYHRRAGSGSSVKVVRQLKPGHVTHHRTDSATSSIHSARTPSRPSSFYAASALLAGEHGQVLEAEELAASPTALSPPIVSPPIVSPLTSATASDERRVSYNSTVLVAHRVRSSHGPPSASPYASASRSSWRKSWGAEPPGWANRTIQAPELHMRGASADLTNHGEPRDVFAGKYGNTSSEEDEWVDEDEDPLFAGGLGQTSAPSSVPQSPAIEVYPDSPLPYRRQLHADTLSYTRKGTGGNKGRTTQPDFGIRAGSGNLCPPEAPNKSKAEVHTSAMNARGRRQLPASRGGPTIRTTAIQEEDEGEE